LTDRSSLLRGEDGKVRKRREGDDDWLKPGTGEGPVLTDTGRAAFVDPFALGTRAMGRLVPVFLPY